MNLLEEFCSQIGLRISINLSDSDIEYTSDTSEFNIVDGEEGDNGVIRYYAIDGDLLAVKRVHGGDSEDVEFTHWGKELLKEKALDIFYENVENIEVEDVF